MEVILDNDDFINDAANYLWYNKLLRIVKLYEYPNDMNMYAPHMWGDRMGLWNNNGVYISDPSQCVLGWVLPNQGSYSYDASSNKLSLTCTDVAALMTETRGGHLVTDVLEMQEALMEVFRQEGTDNSNSRKYAYKNSQGILLEGHSNLSKADTQMENYLEWVHQQKEIDSQYKLPTVWADKYEEYVANKVNKTKIGSSSYDTSDSENYETYNGKTNSTLFMMENVIHSQFDMSPSLPLNIRLQNDTGPLPYDLEFNADSSLMNIIKQVIELYPRQYFFIDSDLRINLVQKALAYNEVEADNRVNFKAREFHGLVIGEDWNKNLENVYNYVVVFGRDSLHRGMYVISSQMVYCDNIECLHTYHSNRNIETGINRDGSNWQEGDGLVAGAPCPNCGNRLKPLYTNNPLCVERYGMHKKVIYDDNLLTDEECFNAAKRIAFESCRTAETISVTLIDRYLSMYQFSTKGVGERIEYTSLRTGETNIYNLLKLTSNFSNRTVTMELEPWYPCVDEHYISDKYPSQPIAYLPVPEFTYTLDDEGNLEMLINNGVWTTESLFKVYISPTIGTASVEYQAEILAGETCEVYREQTENEHEIKVFRYKFKKNGTYYVKCMAWNPNIHYSAFSVTETVTVDI